MFEIGNSLREARLRQGLEIPRIETETKIRGKYLRALEEEQFEVLPGETYVKGFLRTYADYLGLEGQLYVDEYNSRFTMAEEIAAAPSTPRRRRPRPVESNLVVVALAGIVAVTVLVVVGLAGIGSDSPEQPPLVDTNPGPTTTQETSTEPAASGQQPAAPARPARARLVLTAVRGECWVQVRANGERLLSDFDVIADAPGANIEDVRVFSGLSPADAGEGSAGLATFSRNSPSPVVTGEGVGGVSDPTPGRDLRH